MDYQIQWVAQAELGLGEFPIRHGSIMARVNSGLANRRLATAEREARASSGLGEWLNGSRETSSDWIRHDKPQPNEAVFAFGTSDADLLPYEIRTSSPSMLWRLDWETLEVLGERGFTGYQFGELVAGRR